MVDKGKDAMESHEKYTEFRDRVYGYLIRYKNSAITQEKGLFKGKENDCILPDGLTKAKIPAMLYDGIRETVEQIQDSEFRYKPHIFAFKHVASSQTACINLFVPVLESAKADDIIRSIASAPKDFHHIERSDLFHGYRFEFWDCTDDREKGLLGDHSIGAGTDSDVAISYRNKDGDLCLWLIEHKLTEMEFTTCGGYKGKKSGDDQQRICRTCNLGDLYSEHSLCYYDRVSHYNYWKIMSMEGVKDIFRGDSGLKGCPFREGLNQLWRNKLLAIALERQTPNKYKSVFFSVVHHPENYFLDKSICAFRRLLGGNGKFGSFTSMEIIQAASMDKALAPWIEWYSEVYLGRKCR